MALKSIIKPRVSDQEPLADELSVPLGGTRDQAIQRLQVGFFGLGAILLLIGVANVFLQRAEMVEDNAVPEAAATVAADDEAPQQSDPLADAGVVPELPADPDEVEQNAENDPEAAPADDEKQGETSETEGGDQN